MFPAVSTWNGVDHGTNDAWAEPRWYGSDAPRDQFPVVIFPKWVQEMVNASSVSTQTPPDMAAMMALAALAIANQAKARVVIRPGYHEQLSLFVVSCLAPGERKTPVTQQIATPMYDWEREKRRAMTSPNHNGLDDLDVEMIRLRMAKSKLAYARTEKRIEEALAEMRAQRYAVDSVVVPAIPRLLTDDVTPQKFSALLGENSGRMGILSGEPGLFETLVNSRISVLLKGFSGDEVRVDRISRKGEMVSSPAISLGLAMQPELLRGLARRKGMKDRGLLGRFLYSVPPSAMGTRNPNPPKLDQAIALRWNQNLRLLLDLPMVSENAEKNRPRDIKLSPEAAKEFARAAVMVEAALSPGGGLDIIADWGGKLVGQFARIAGNLHMAELAEDGALDGEALDLPPISGETMEKVVSLYPYLVAHALGAYALMGANGDPAGGQYLLEVIRKKKVIKFLRQDAWQWTRGRFQRTSEFDAAIAELIERGFIRETKRIGVPGRPATFYVVNPVVFGNE